MGWTINFKSNQSIDEKTIDDIVNSLPQKYSTEHLIKPIYPNFKHKQSWGWSVVCDINKPQNKSLTISGSASISGLTANEFSLYLKQELENRGHIIKVAEPIF